MQEAAQYLAGEALPTSLISSILAKTSITSSETCLMINLTTYDGWLEKTIKKWPDQGVPPVRFKSLSLCKAASVAQFVEKALALELLQENRGSVLCFNE